MASIDLFEDFNEEYDRGLGDLEEDDDNQNENAQGSDNNDPENPNDENRQEVDPGIKVKKPKRKLVTLNAERLKGPRGIIAIDDFFKNIKLKGKGYEKEDLNDVMKRLEYWSHRMFPKYNFDDSLTKIERLGRKKEIAFHMTRYRLGQLTQEDDIRVQSDNEDDRMEDTLAHELPVDEFEDMLNQQIALSSTTNRFNNDTSVGNLNMSTVSSSTQIAPKPLFSQELFGTQEMEAASQPKTSQLTDEQKARIEENRKRAMARRAAKLKEQNEDSLAHELPADDFDAMLSSSKQNNDKSISTSTENPANPPISQELFGTQEVEAVPQPKTPQLTDEQKARIEENKKRALAIRAAKMKELEEKKQAEEQKLKAQRAINIEIDDDFC